MGQGAKRGRRKLGSREVGKRGGWEAEKQGCWEAESSKNGLRLVEV
jgi:hypothetical protein